MSFSPPQVLEPVYGTQISFADWNQLLNFVTQTTGFCTAFQQGEASASTLLQPLTIATNGTMTPTIGAITPSQFVLCQGLLCASASATPFTVLPNAGGTRTDTIWIQPALPTVLTVTRSVENNTGVKNPQQIPVVISGISVFYQVGGGSAPSGTWTQFATIAVPNGATAITSGEITYLLPQMNPTGATGPAGHGTTTSVGTFTVPAVAASVNVTVVDGTAFPNGQYLAISDGTHAFVGLVTGVSGEVLSVQCALITLGASGNTMANGATVTFSGKPGTAGSNGTNGTNGTNGHGSTVSTGPATIPAVGSTVVVAVADGTAFPNGTYVILSDGTNAIAGVVTSGGTTNSLTIENIGVISGSGTIASAATLTFSGAQLTTAFFAAALPVQSASPGSTPQTETINLVIPNVGTTWYVEIDANTSCGSSGTAVGALTQTAGGSPTGGVLMTNGSGLGGYQKYVAEFAAGQTLTFQFVGTFTGTGPYITTLTAKALRIS